MSGLLLLILPSISKYKKYQQKKADELSSKANGNVSSVKAEKKMIDVSCSKIDNVASRSI